MLINFLDLGFYNDDFEEAILDDVRQILRNGIFINGPETKKFSSKFSKYIGCEFGLSVANGTDALEIALSSMCLDPNSEIIIPENTFFATAEAVVTAGYKPVIAPVCAKSNNLTVETIKSVETRHTKAVIFVHLYGNPVGVEEVADYCTVRGYELLEDCAQAHGAKIQDRFAGTFGRFGCFSFYPGKVLGGIGDAGFIACKFEDDFERIRRIANHGRLQKFDHKIFGRNSRMDEVQAAYLSRRLDYLEQDIEQRSLVAETYHLNINNDFVKLFPLNNLVRHAYHLYVMEVQADHYVGLIRHLELSGIQTGVHYPQLLQNIEAFGGTPYDEDRCMRNIVSLPIGPHMSVEAALHVCREINAYAG